MQISLNIPTSEELVDFIDTQQGPLATGDIADHFGLTYKGQTGGRAYESLRSLLHHLVVTGQVACKQKRPGARRYYYSKQKRPGARRYYYSVPRLVEAVQQEQEENVYRFKVGLQPKQGAAISLDDLKAKAHECRRHMLKLATEQERIEQELEKLANRLDVLLSLIQPFDDSFRVGL
jgi:hypothetical protein